MALVVWSAPSMNYVSVQTDMILKACSIKLLASDHLFREMILKEESAVRAMNSFYCYVVLFHLEQRERGFLPVLCLAGLNMCALKN